MRLLLASPGTVIPLREVTSSPGSARQDSLVTGWTVRFVPQRPADWPRFPGRSQV